MHELPSYRDPAKPFDIELQCPACTQGFFIAQPDREASVAACPHRDCQVVCLVRIKRNWDGTRDYLAASLDTLVATPARDFPWVPVLGIYVMFVLFPVWLWSEAWSLELGLRVAVMCFTAPALLFAALSFSALVADVLTHVRRARLTCRRTRAALQKAAWIGARERPD